MDNTVVDQSSVTENNIYNSQGDTKTINDKVEPENIKHKIEAENSSEHISTSEIESKNEIQTQNKIDEIKASETIEHNKIEENKPEILDNKIEETIEDKPEPTKTEESNKQDDDDFIDILGNGLLTKKTLKKGLGRETRPTHGDKVTIEYEGFNSKGESFVSETASFIVGDGDMIQAFDLGICLSEKQEEFELKTDARFAYGSIGNAPDIDPDENLKYHIKLLSVDDAPDYTTYSYEDRLEEVDKKRERGNYFYKREEYPLAVNSYSKALKIINTDPEYKLIATDEKKTDLFDLFIKVTNNLAAAQLKMDKYDCVIETCNSVLEYQPENVKALFRKGKSLCNTGNYDEAISVLKYAQTLENSKLISNELIRCTNAKREETEQRARICRKMFKSNNTDSNCNNEQLSTFSRLKSLTYAYSPYVAAVIVTGISMTFAYLTVTKEK